MPQLNGTGYKQSKIWDVVVGVVEVVIVVPSTLHKLLRTMVGDLPPEVQGAPARALNHPQD
jgi:hypothetical protein